MSAASRAVAAGAAISAAEGVTVSVVWRWEPGGRGAAPPLRAGQPGPPAGEFTGELDQWTRRTPAVMVGVFAAARLRNPALTRYPAFP